MSIAAGMPREVAIPAMAAFGIIPVPHSGCASPSAGRHYDLAEIWALITPHPHIVTRELYPNSAEMGRDPRRSACHRRRFVNRRSPTAGKAASAHPRIPAESHRGILRPLSPSGVAIAIVFPTNPEQP